MHQITAVNRNNVRELLHQPWPSANKTLELVSAIPLPGEIQAVTRLRCTNPQLSEHGT